MHDKIWQDRTEYDMPTLEVQDQGLSPGSTERLSPPGSSRGRVCVCVCVLISSSKDHSLVGSGATLVASLELHPLLKDPISKRSHILRSWGWGLLHMMLGGCDSAHKTSLCTWRWAIMDQLVQIDISVKQCTIEVPWWCSKLSPCRSSNHCCVSGSIPGTSLMSWVQPK